MQLTTDHWQGVRANHVVVADATWLQVEAAVRALDDRLKTEVLLGWGADAGYISVGGGAGRYFVFVYTEEERNVILTAPGRSDDLVQLFCGGQGIRVPQSQVVDLDAALKACDVYFHKGTPDRSLVWLEE